MKIKELIKILKEQSEDAEVVFYNFLHGDDMTFKNISVADDGSEVYFNIR